VSAGIARQPCSGRIGAHGEARPGRQATIRPGRTRRSRRIPKGVAPSPSRFAWVAPFRPIRQASTTCPIFSEAKYGSLRLVEMVRHSRIRETMDPFPFRPLKLPPMPLCRLIGNVCNRTSSARMVWSRSPLREIVVCIPSSWREGGLSAGLTSLPTRYHFASDPAGI